MTQRSRLSTTLSGVAGEYFVAAQLSRLGYLASVTLKNTRGIDILAANTDATRSVGIQVKTNQGSSKEWMLNKKVETGYAENLFFVFVNLHDVDAAPSFHVVPSKTVAAFCRRSHQDWLKTPGRGGKKHKDTAMRKFADPSDKYRDRWDQLGLGEAAVQPT